MLIKKLFKNPIMIQIKNQFPYKKEMIKIQFKSQKNNQFLNKVIVKVNL
jgi:hypothetical protein